MRVIWVIPLLAALLGAFELVSGFHRAESAPQQAAVAAYICAIVIVPYVGARALQGIASAVNRDEQMRLMHDIYDRLQRISADLRSSRDPV